MKGTIHLRRRQILAIFDPYPPPVGSHRHSNKSPPPTVLRFEVKVAVLAKLRLKIMTFLSHKFSPMLVYALNTI